VTRYLPDVNLVVASLRVDHPHHNAAQNFLHSAKSNADAFVVPVEMLASTMRILMLDIWVAPESSASASALMRSWVQAADAEVVGHPEASFAVLTEFARTLNLSARRVPDALLAACAIALRATLVSFDRGFSGYPGLPAKILGP
jgi:Predicted nucleic acid-binding protein, contains PIN domain